MPTKGSSKRLRIFKSSNPSNFNLNVRHDIGKKKKIFLNVRHDIEKKSM